MEKTHKNIQIKKYCLIGVVGIHASMWLIWATKKWCKWWFTPNIK